MHNQYNIATHSILPLLYRILGPANHISYLLKDPSTRSLFFFNPLFNMPTQQSDTENKYHSWLIDHVNNIQKISQCKLTHIVCNHAKQRESYEKLQAKIGSQIGRKEIKLLMPMNEKGNNQIRPEVIGQISVCFIGAEGYLDDYNLIGVTHISPTSTKLPVLFVNTLLGLCSIDNQSTVSNESYLKSLDKVKYFPNETYIFPSSTAQKPDLLFAKAILSTEQSNARVAPIIDQKIQTFEKNNKTSPDCLIPTTLLEQKLMNPFLFPQKYHKLLQVKNKDKAKCFGLLRTMRKEWKGQA